MIHDILLIAWCGMGWPSGGTHGDVQFRLAVNASLDVPQGSTPFRFLPERSGRLLRMLGSGDYDSRRFAEVEVAGMGPRAIPLLSWGLRSADPQIRMTSGRLLQPYLSCSECVGTGTGRLVFEDEPWRRGWRLGMGRCDQHPDEYPFGISHCPSCHGLGFHPPCVTRKEPRP